MQRYLSSRIHYNCSINDDKSLNIKVIISPLGAATSVVKRIQQKQVPWEWPVKLLNQHGLF